MKYILKHSELLKTSKNLICDNRSSLKQLDMMHHFRLLLWSSWDYALLGYYAAFGGNSLQTFWDNILVPSSLVKKSKKKGFEICAFLWYDTAYGGDPLPTFWEKLLIPSSGSRNSRRKDFLIPEDGTDRLS